jgi:Fur family ferric uptake transcriptional regulator
MPAEAADHQLVCRSCGAVADVACALRDPACLEPSDPRGFVIDEAAVTFWGLCPDCQAA